MRLWPVVTGVAIALTLVACKSPTPPKGVQPITGFDASRYLGKWYEVARLENRFERGLEQVTATYGKRSDGGISVLNRGYDPVKKKWNESEGKAYFTGEPTTSASISITCISISRAFFIFRLITFSGCSCCSRPSLRVRLRSV